MSAGNLALYTDHLKDNFDEIYLANFYRLYRFVYEYVQNKEDAENIVQDIFVLLWEKRHVLNIQISLIAYIFSLAKNKCIDHLRKKIVSDTYNREMRVNLMSLENLNMAFCTEEDIESLISAALDKLPERCREIFIKSRIEGKQYKQIAEEMGISIHTVDMQIRIALKKLRIELKDYLPLLIFLSIC